MKNKTFDITIRVLYKPGMVGITYNECCSDCFAKRKAIVPMVIMDDDSSNCIFCGSHNASNERLWEDKIHIYE